MSIAGLMIRMGQPNVLLMHESMEIEPKTSLLSNYFINNVISILSLSHAKVSVSPSGLINC